MKTTKPRKAQGRATQDPILHEAPDPERAMTPFATHPGQPHPLGATVSKDGVNFSVFSQHATAMELLLFATEDATEPMQVVRMAPKDNLSFHFWHVFVLGARPGLHYAFRADGPFLPEAGLRFDAGKVLIDPYARGNSMVLWDRVAATRPGCNLATAMRSVVIDPAPYDWEGDAPLRRPMKDTIIYEMHLAGFTRGPGAGVARPGKPRTWLGGMLTRKPPMLVRVALANKMARIVWALMARGGVYKAPAMAA